MASDAETARDLIEMLADEEHVITPADRALLRLVLERLIRPTSDVTDRARAERDRCLAIADDMATGESRTPMEKAIGATIARRIRGGGR